MDSVIPDKPERMVEEEASPEKTLCESDKLQYFVENSNMTASTAEKLLPRLFKAYEDSISSQMRHKTLALIDKIIALMDSQMLQNFVEPYEFAKFLFGIFKGGDLGQTLISCQIVK